MTPRRCIVVSLLAAVAATARLAGQAPAQRVALHLFRDSLRSVSDSAVLLAAEQRGIAAARADRDDAMLHMRLGFLALRLGRVTGSSDHYGDAKTEFDWARQLQSQWPYAWFGAGLASLERVAAEPPFYVTFVALYGADPYGEARHDLVHSAELAPAFPEGLVDVADLALQGGKESSLRAVLEVLRSAAATTAGASTAAMLARIDVENDVGQPDSAVAVATRLLQRDPGNAAALLAYARSNYFMGRNTGAPQWFRGLGLADSAIWQRYRADLAPLLADTLLAALDRDTPAQRVVRLRRFWASRDALGAGADRLAAHYQRLAYALAHYAVHWHGDPRDPAGSLDDRGLIYLRHGPPEETSSLDLSGVPPNESWRYGPDAGGLVFHFLAANGHAPFRLVPSVLDILAASGQARIGRIDTGDQARIETYGAGLIAQTAQELLRSREPISPIYQQMLGEGIGGARKLQAEERATGRRDDAIGLSTDSWHTGYELALTADMQLVATAADRGGSEVQVAYAIPGASLVPRRLGTRWLYLVRTRIAVLGPDSSLVAVVDTTRGFVTPAWIAPAASLLATVAVPVPPGDYTATVALESAGRGIVFPGHAVAVAALSDHRLALSDLALGARNVPLWWTSPRGDTSWIAPSATFSRRDPMELGFLIGGLGNGAGYRTELTVVRVSARDVAGELAAPALRGKAMMRIALAGTAAGGVVDVHRELSLEKLAPGDYILEVAITSPAGGRAVRRRPFTVIK